SAFNTIIPQHLFEKLSLLGLNTSLCKWILDYMTGRPQSVRIGNCISNTTTLSTGAPQGCVLSPLLFTLLIHSLNHIIKFADDMTVVGLVSKNNESAYREEESTEWPFAAVHRRILCGDRQEHQIPWCTPGGEPHLVTQHERHQQNSSAAPLLPVEAEESPSPSPILTMFYKGIIESVLSSCTTACFGNCTVSDRKTLQQIVRTAEKIIGVSVPSITDMYTTRCICKANSIVDDPIHPSHTLFTLLPSAK
ncbi:hypothetical protein QTP70_018383, partial [Hemibagrus guttatus]